VSEGFLRQPVANNSDVQVKLMRLISVFKIQSRRFNSQDRQIHIKAILNKLTSIELESVSPESSTKFTLNQLLGLCNRFNGESIVDADNLSFITDFQTVVKSWVDKLDSNIQVFDAYKNELRELTRLEKGRIIAELINSLSDDKPDF
jgi:hypothetical protein